MSGRTFLSLNPGQSGELKKISQTCFTVEVCFLLIIFFHFLQNIGYIYTLCLKKGTPTLSTVTLERINKFEQFLAQIFLTQLAIKWLFSFPPHRTSAPTLPGENRTNEICTEVNNKRQQTGD